MKGFERTRFNSPKSIASSMRHLKCEKSFAYPNAKHTRRL